MLSSIIECTTAGQKVTVAGFGTFQARDRAGRAGRNPRTGEALHSAATRTVSFHAGTAYKRLVAGNDSRDAPAAAQPPPSPTTPASKEKSAATAPAVAKPARKKPINKK